MIVARGAAPVDARGRLTRYEAAELPEVLARAGAAAAMQAVDHGRGGAPPASISAWRARGPGPQAIDLATSPPSGPGRAERTSARIASTTDSPTGRRRTRRCAAIRSSALIAALALVSSAPVVSLRIL